MNLSEVLSAVFSTQSLLAIFIGSVVGIIIGVVPGIGAGVGMALLIPLTFYMGPVPGLLFLLSLWAADGYGASISSILINVPGGAGAVVTALDGYQLSKQGRAGEALGYSIMSSAVGGIISTLGLMLFGPLVANFALRFGPPEYFLLALFGLSFIATSSKGDYLRGLISASLGLAVSFIGYDLITGVQRYTFGSLYLYDGLSLQVVLVGLFALSQMIDLSGDQGTVALEGQIKGGVGKGLIGTFRYLNSLLRGSAIGTVLGATPGVGIAAASWIAYYSAQRASKSPDTFGKGNPEGVIAPEAANNAVQGGGLVPTMALGIPGSSSAAIFLGALVMYGLRPGPMLFEKSGTLVWTLFIGLIIANIAFVFWGSVLANFFAKVTLVPVSILVPMVLVFSYIGAFADNNSIIDLWIVTLFGVVGFAMSLLRYPTVPAILAIVLGPMLEENFSRAMLLSDGSYQIFYKSTLAKALIVLVIFSLVMPLLKEWRIRRQLLMKSAEQASA